MTEFELIKRFFQDYPLQQPHNRLGIGDDCALLQIPPDYQLAVTTDTMVENVHFFAGVNPESLGHKLLAVNLSDLAAMGAEPIAVSLALTLPKIDTKWLSAFSRGFMHLAAAYRVDLIGGDTTAGPLTLTVQAMGLIPQGQALLRSTAKVGDLVYVTGQIGNAGLGLKITQGYACAAPEAMLTCFNSPQPRVSQGLALRGVASACIDISDGLSADLGHILKSSGLGATLQWEDLPLSPQVQAYIISSGDWQMPLTAGDDYELCFTAPADQQSALPAGCLCIGKIEAEPGLRLIRNNELNIFQAKGFEHFS